ncbi:MAG: hypothetical protein GY928_16340 [Colwellia sp.]|nr:hypothetical protein [Colwellia sp.]
MVDKKHIDNYINQMGEPTVASPIKPVVSVKKEDSYEFEVVAIKKLNEIYSDIPSHLGTYRDFLKRKHSDIYGDLLNAFLSH